MVIGSMTSSESKLSHHLLEKSEEAERFKQVGPGVPLHEDAIADVQASFELPDHDVTRGVGHVEGGVLLGVRRCYDGHQVIPICRVDLERE